MAGHGATNFFQRLRDQQKLQEFVMMYSSHPVHSQRISDIETEIKEKGYSVAEVSPPTDQFKPVEPVSTPEEAEILATDQDASVSDLRNTHNTLSP